MRKQYGHRIREVLADSIAFEMEVEAGDLLLSIDGEEIEDVFDYRYRIREERLLVLIEKPNGDQWELEIEKDPEEDLGILFENDLMSEYHSCSNRCLFCFIDQMPPGMRDTLYFKDDDSRLSFLQGNYITLTNLKEKDVDRIIRFHLAPINISVHTTNPELRCKMLRNRFAGTSLQYLKKLYEHEIEMNGQIVLCKGINDGEELSRTIRDLSAYLPYMRSVSVVPAGITRYREGLYPIALLTREDACQVIDQIEAYQKQFYQQYGLHFVHASDELYILAGRDFPEEERYDGYLQLENGVGMMRLLKEEYLQALQERKKEEENGPAAGTSLLLATGLLAAPLLKKLAEETMKCYPQLTIRVCPIENHFFGENITVSGLITGADLVEQTAAFLKKEAFVPDRLLIPSNMLRMGEDVFLDDRSLLQVQEELGLPVCPVDTSGQDLLQAILDGTYEMIRQTGNVGYIQAYADISE